MPTKNKIRKLKLTNTDPVYWERVLESYGLGVNQRMTDNSNEKSTEAQGTLGSRGSFGPENSKMTRLDQLIDKDDPFKWGHEIKSGGHFGQPERVLPEWAIGDGKIKEILLTVFPKMFTDGAQRQRAGLWLRVFYLYYRLGMTETQVGKEVGMNRNQVSMTLRTLNYTSKGLNKHGKPRKRKGTAPVQVHVGAPEGTGREENEGVQSSHVLTPGDGSTGEARTAS